MEFLRFGSSIPGSYWGCCAVCIIQNFKVDPDAKAAIQLVGGDSGTPLMKNSEFIFSGPTWADIFKQRIRIGTFSEREMPNHAFFAVLTSSQISGGVGAKWLKILKEEGFEFLRTIDNSVYTGDSVLTKTTLGTDGGVSSHPNYIFALFRNIGKGAITNPFTPPKAWTDLDPVTPETWERIEEVDQLAKSQQAQQLEHWKKGTKPVFLKEDELLKLGLTDHTIWYAGKRSTAPQMTKATRALLEPKPTEKADPFAAKAPPSASGKSSAA